MPDASPLDSLLTDLIEAHDSLLAALDDQRRAITDANPDALARATRRQQHYVAAIHSLEERWRAIVVEHMRVRPGLAIGKAGQPTLETLCGTFAEPDGSRMRDRAAQLRELVMRVRAQTRALRTTTGALIGHMDGLMAQLGRCLSSTGAYTRSGASSAGPVVGALDLTS